MRSAPLLAICLVGCALMASGCQPETGATAETTAATVAAEPAGSAQPPGHRRMLELLSQIAEQSRLDNPYLGQGIAPELRRQLAAVSDAPEDLPKRWLFNVLLGKHELRLGNEQTALDHYLEAYRLLGASADAVPPSNVVRTLFELGVAYMRWGETQNCVEHHQPESCLFPIRNSGVHRFQEGSRNAVRCFEDALEVVRPGSIEYLRSQWLLNIAYMTLGEYPQGVPEPYRIDPELFESELDFARFTDVAPGIGLNSVDLAGGAAVEDFNGDGRLDVMVSTMDTEGQLRLFVNGGDGTFTERTRRAGLIGLTGGLNLNQADYDGDGDMDVLVLRGGWWRQRGRHPNSLLRNNADGTFTDVTFDAGLGHVHYPTQTAAWSDYDLDGDLDLYVGNENGEAMRFDEDEATDVRAPGQLFRNDGDGTFTDVAAAAGVENLRYAKGVVWGDYDNDRYPDLYVSNLGGANRLYHNNGDGTFTDRAPELGLTRPIASFPVWFWDANNDGNLDLFVAGYGGARLPADVGAVAGSYLGLGTLGELPALYLGDGKGGFRDVAEQWNLTRISLPMGANYGDLDNDGFLDFYLGTGYPHYEGLMPNVMFHNRAGRAFADVSTAGGFGHLQKGHGVVFADLDDDGDQDVYEQIGGAFPGDGYGNALFENPGSDNHWIKLRLVGTRSNRHGVGARIRIDVTVDGTRRSIHDRVATGGSFGANPLRREIGLGSARTIDLLEIYWPASDGTQQFRDVAVDRLLEITEGRDEYRELPLSPHSLASRKPGR